MKYFSSTADLIYLKKHGHTSIGSGAYGEVKLVQHKTLRSGPFALKTMALPDKNELKYIQKEIDLHRGLDHPFIIKLEDFFIEDNKAYVLIEYANNGDLHKYLHKTLSIPENDLKKIFVQVVLAIQYLHKKNILHRDIKPENILLDTHKNVKLCDFGWSVECSDFQIRKTFCGTPEYMPPELIFGNGQTKKSEIYSLGKFFNIFNLI